MNNTKSLQNICNKRKYTWDVDKNGHLYCSESECKLAQENDCGLIRSICLFVNSKGHLRSLERAFNKNKLDWSPLLGDIAALNGWLNILGWAYDKKYELDLNSCLDYAEEEGIEYILDWIHGLKEHQCDSCMNAVEKGRLSCLKRAFKQNKLEWSCNLGNIAAENGHLKILKWAYDKKYELNLKSCLDYAKENDHKDIIEWIHDLEDHQCDSCINAVKKGHLNCLEQAFKQNKLKWYPNLGNIAASYGHLEILEWAYDNKYELYLDSCLTFAEKNRHLDIIDWIHDLKDHQCDSCIDAVKKGHLSCLRYKLEYAEKNGFTLNESDIDLFLIHAENNDQIHVVNWIMRIRGQELLRETMKKLKM